MIGVAQGDGYGFIKKKWMSNPQTEGDKPAQPSDRTTYTKQNFQLDIANFIDTFYDNKPRAKSTVERIVEFMYTDWMHE